MSLRRTTRSAAKVGVAIAMVYALRAALRRMEQRSANAGLAKGKRFLILGAGFAGAAVARELARLLPDKDNGEILLIDEDNYLLFTPMLTEAAGGELETSEIVSPVRLLGKRVSFTQGSVTKINLEKRTADVSTGDGQLDPAQQILAGDHLVLALGSVVNFHNTPGVAENAIPMKRLQDASRAFHHVSACIERASVEPDSGKRKELLTFVVGGGGYTGVETMAAINDLVRSNVQSFPRIDPSEVRTIIIHPGDRLLPEITPELAAYATEKLKQRGTEVRLGAKIAGAGSDFVEIEGGERIASDTLIWAAGVTPNPLLKDLPAQKGKHHGLVVNGCMQVSGHAGVWALGDCAEIPQPGGKGTYAPTAQNATREGKLLAANIVSTLRNGPLQEFRYTPVGELALVGRHSGVARVYGRNFSGTLAWAMWRAIYLAKMPSLAQQSRILVEWLLDIVLGRPAVPLSTGSQVQTGR